MANEPIAWTDPTLGGQGGEYFLFEWPGAAIISVDRIYEDKQYTHCEITIASKVPALEGHLHRASFNLSATNPRKSLTNYLNSRIDLVDWEKLLEFVCAHVLDIRRQGNPVIEVGYLDRPEMAISIVHPIIPLNMRTIIYGEGASAKSYLALLLGMSTLIPDAPVWNKLGLRPAENQGGVLYLDYEVDEWEINDRIQRLRRGMDIEEAVIIDYQSRSQALGDSIPELRRLIVEKKISLMIVDSLGAACGGDPSDPGLALRMMNALRNLNITAILVDHETKNAGDKQRAKGPFGSVYKYNLARSVWEVRKSQGQGEDSIKVSLIHRKANNSRLFKTMGFEFSFDDTATYVKRIDIRGVPELASGATVKSRILKTLESGKWTVDQLVGELPDISRPSIKKNLSELKVANQVGNDEPFWFLPYRVTP